MRGATEGFHWVVSAKDSALRLSEVPLDSMGENEVHEIIHVDLTEQFQEFIGFGGSFTEASAIALSRMSPAKRTEAISAFFCPEKGHGYTVARTHINSCDFSTGDWDYVDMGDESLRSFSLERDEALLLPLIRDAEAVAGQRIRLIASPWSPPSWMKTNADMKHGGKLRPEYHQLWADYMVLYLQRMQEKGFDLWGLTPQNEPQAVQVWESCIYDGEEQRDFIREHLGPALHREGMQDVKLMVWDHNKDELMKFCTPILEDPEASKYVWGAAYHWYSGDDFHALHQFHETFPDKHLLFSEGCMEGGVKLGDWRSAERYAHDIVGDLEGWTVGWVDWNIVLDETGGPNHVGNLCDAPIIADGRTDTLHYQPSYWALGHFARYIKPGARRVGSSGGSVLETTSFLNPDGSRIVVLLNRSDDEVRALVEIDGRKIQVTLPAHAIGTLIQSADS